MANNNIAFISNNVKGLKDDEKRIKLFEYLKNSVIPNGLIFLQETHSCKNNEKTWAKEFEGQLYFSHAKSNSCGVAIGYLRTKKFELKSKKTDKNGRILIIEANVDNTAFLLINLYNPNKEKDQVLILSELDNMLETYNNISNNMIVLDGDFNFFFNTRVEAIGGNPKLKKNSVTKFIELKEKYYLCDIWRIRNLKSKRYTFRQHHASGLLQRRLDYFFIYKDYTDKMKQHIAETMHELDTENSFDDQMKWEFLKFEIRRFTIDFSKLYAKKQRQEILKLESNLKYFESHHQNYENHDEYISCKNKLDLIYEGKAKGIKVRSRCDWYEHGEKSTKFFLNLEKYHATQSDIRSILVDEKELTDRGKINTQLVLFCNKLFSKNLAKQFSNLETYLEKILLPKLSLDQKQLCKGNSTEKELFTALKSMENNKSPGNDGLTKEFYIAFWTEIKNPFLASVQAASVKGELSTSQRQAAIKLTEKRDRGKRLIKNWRPISLLNIDMKLITKVLATRLKKVLPSLISPNQTGYVENRFIGESGRLISDMLEITKTLKKEGFLITIDIEKAFDSVDHNFLLTSLDKYGFGEQFLSWIKTI